MALQAYFPNAEADRIEGSSNYRAKNATHGPAVQQYAQAATAYKNQIANGEGSSLLPAITTITAQPTLRPAGVLNWLFAQITRFKTHAGYTETLGRDLGVIATASSSDHPIPDFTANVETGASSLVGCETVKVSLLRHLGFEIIQSIMPLNKIDK